MNTIREDGALDRLDRMTSATPVLRVSDVDVGTRTWVWSMTLDEDGQPDAKSASIIGQVTRPKETFRVDGYERTIYGLVSGEDEEAALQNVLDDSEDRLTRVQGP